jgi:DNA-binding MarR family transcriptional regulator
VSGDESSLKLVDAQPPAPYCVQEQVGFLLRRAHQRHVAIFAAHIGDLTPPQFAALSTLRDAGETSQNQLGMLVAMDAATIKGVIDRLKARGLVELTRHDADKRRLMVALTAEGVATVERLTPVAEEISRETVAALSEKDAEVFLRLLGKVA